MSFFTFGGEAVAEAKETYSDSSSESDDLTSDVLKLQSSYFPEPAVQGTGDVTDHHVVHRSSLPGRNDTSAAPSAPASPAQHHGERKVRLPSVSDAFVSTTVRFRKEAGPAKHVTKTEYASPAVPSQGVLSGGAATPAAAPPSAPPSTLGLPEAGTWHVPLTFVDVVACKRKQFREEEKHMSKEMKKVQAEADFVRRRGARDPTNAAASEQKRATIKEREKQKRQKGQSTHDSWKPEAWMKMRQEFD